MLMEQDWLPCSEVCWLGVWEENHRAISFYQKFGFEKIGVKEFLVGSVVDRDWILELRLEAP